MKRTIIFILGSLFLLACVTFNTQCIASEGGLSADDSDIINVLAVGRTLNDRCTATLFDERLVLTAGHCTIKKKDAFNLDEYYHKNKFSTYERNGGVKDEMAGKVHLRPEYKLGIKNKSSAPIFDIGVIELEKPLTDIDPFHINPYFGDHSILKEGTELNLLTYGPNEWDFPGDRERRLIPARVSKIDRVGLIRFGTQEGKILSGDSGAPVFIGAGNYTSLSMAFGVIGVLSQSNAFEDVSRSYEWILSGTIPIKTGEPQEGYLYKGEWAHYKFEPGEGAHGLFDFYRLLHQVVLYDLSADLDLYINVGCVPTKGNHTCRPYLSYNKDEPCFIANGGEEKTWYISVHAYQAGSYKLRIGGTESTSSKYSALKPTLLSGSSRRNFVNKGEWNHYKIETRRLDEEIIIGLNVLSGDPDLYVRRGRAPSLNDFDCRPYHGSLATEECKMRNEDGAVTTWYISVHGYAKGNYELSLKGQ